MRQKPKYSTIMVDALLNRNVPNRLRQNVYVFFTFSTYHHYCNFSATFTLFIIAIINKTVKGVDLWS